MGLKMRMTHNQKDYMYQLNEGTVINKQSTEISVTLNGKSMILKKTANMTWMLTEDENLEAGFAHALGRLISLRYRL
jgi:hypothetical protein